MKDERASACLTYEKFESFQRPSVITFITLIWATAPSNSKIYEIILPTAALLRPVLKEFKFINQKTTLSKSYNSRVKLRKYKILKSNS